MRVIAVSVIDYGLLRTVAMVVCVCGTPTSFLMAQGPAVLEAWQWDIIMPRLKEFQRSTRRTALVPKLLYTNKAIGS